MIKVEIEQATTLEERRKAFPILQELRSHLTADSFDDLYAEMAEEGYHLFVGFEENEPVAVAGVTISTNFYLGRHAYVYDLVTTETRRSEGYGKGILLFVHEWAEQQGCDAVELESGLWRDDAHRFYEQLGYEKYCYSFKYDLD